MSHVTEGTIRSVRGGQVPQIALVAGVVVAVTIVRPLTTMPDRYAPAHIAS